MFTINIVVFVKTISDFFLFLSLVLNKYKKRERGRKGGISISFSHQICSFQEDIKKISCYCVYKRHKDIILTGIRSRLLFETVKEQKFCKKSSTKSITHIQQIY